jgi:hypothetical protein
LIKKEERKKEERKLSIDLSLITKKLEMCVRESDFS